MSAASQRSLGADVVVIGSGMGGGTPALALARRGVNPALTIAAQALRVVAESDLAA